MVRKKCGITDYLIMLSNLRKKIAHLNVIFARRKEKIQK